MGLSDSSEPGLADAVGRGRAPLCRDPRLFPALALGRAHGPFDTFKALVEVLDVGLGGSLRRRRRIGTLGSDLALRRRVCARLGRGRVGHFLVREGGLEQVSSPGGSEPAHDASSSDVAAREENGSKKRDRDVSEPSDETRARPSPSRRALVRPERRQSRLRQRPASFRVRKLPIEVR